MKGQRGVRGQILRNSYQLRRFPIWSWLAASAAAGEPLKFEAATVKRAAPNDTTSGTSPITSPGRFEFRNVTLRVMIYWAYGSGLSTAMSVSGGPDWMNRNRYTIEAVAPGNPTDREYRGGNLGTDGTKVWDKRPCIAARLGISWQTMRVLILTLFLTASAAAQWLHLPTPGVPRKADGRPDLTAPAPKSSSGKPDFSGMWIPRDVLPCDAAERGVQCVELPLTPQLVNFAAGLKDGLPYQPWAAELVKNRSKDVGFLDPHTHCMPPNFPRAWAFPETEKIFQTPTELVILHEYNASYRQIFFDGRSLPDDMLPAWNGYSIAHWEGATLVVDSAGYRDDSWLDTAGDFFSSAARVTERIRRPNFGSLDVDVTVDDPKVFTKPWTVALHMKPLLDTEMIDFICLENNKDVQHLVR